MKTFGEALDSLRARKFTPSAKDHLSDPRLVQEIVRITKHVRALGGSIEEAVAAAMPIGLEIGQEMMREDNGKEG